MNKMLRDAVKESREGGRKLIKVRRHGRWDAKSTWFGSVVPTKEDDVYIKPDCYVELPAGYIATCFALWMDNRSELLGSGTLQLDVPSKPIGPKNITTR